MPDIFINTDNSDNDDKIYDGLQAGKAQAKAEEKMQKAVRKMIAKADGFTTTKPDKDPKGYTIRLTVAKVEIAGRNTKCSLTGGIAIFPVPPTKTGKEGTLMLTKSMVGNANATGTDERALLDCVESIAEDLTTKAVPIMRADFAGRTP